MTASASTAATLPHLPAGARIITPQSTETAAVETYTRAPADLVDLRVRRILTLSTQRAQKRLACLKQLFVVPRATVKTTHARAIQSVVNRLCLTKSVRNVKRVNESGSTTAADRLCLPLYSCTSLALPDGAAHGAGGLSSNSALVATGSVDGVVTVWEAQSCRPLCSISTCVDGGWGRVRSLVSHPTAPICFSTTMFDRRIRAWKMQPGVGEIGNTGGDSGGGNEEGSKPASTSASSGWTLSMAASTAAPTLGTGAEEAHVGHTARINRLAVDPTGTLLASASEDATVRLWDIRRLDDVTPESLSLTARNLYNKQQQSALATGDNGACDLPLLLTHDGYADAGGVTAVSFHPDGSLLSTTDVGGRVLTWDTRTGQLAFATAGTLRGGHLGRATCVAWSPCGVRLASAGADHVVQLWDARMVFKSVHADQNRKTGTAASATHTGSAPYMMVGHEDVVTSLSFYTDLSGASGSSSWRSVLPLALVSTSLDGTVRLWDADTGLCARTLRADGAVYDHCRLRIGAEACTNPAVSQDQPISAASSSAALVSVGHSKYWSVWDVVHDATTFTAHLAETEEEIDSGSAGHLRRRAQNEEAEGSDENADDGDEDSEDDEMAALRRPGPAPPATNKVQQAHAEDEDSDDDEMAALLRK